MALSHLCVVALCLTFATAPIPASGHPPPPPPPATHEAPQPRVRAGEAVLGRYPGYKGPLRVRGTFVVEQAAREADDRHDRKKERPAEHAIAVHGHLEGVERNVRAGWHIHVGKTCADAAKVGGHFHPHSKIDTWQNVNYRSNAQGAATVNAVVPGLDLAEALGHALVIHARDGARIGCGVIRARRPPTTPAGRPHPEELAHWDRVPEE
eukprot:EG_transcript_28937